MKREVIKNASWILGDKPGSAAVVLEVAVSLLHNGKMLQEEHGLSGFARSTRGR
jgi:hypothetical protein